MKGVVDRSLRSADAVLPQSAERDFAAGIWSGFLDLSEPSDADGENHKKALQRLDTRTTQARQLDIVAAGWIDRYRVERRQAAIANRNARVHVAAGTLAAAREADRVALLSARRAENAEFAATSALYRDWVTLAEPDANDPGVREAMETAWSEHASGLSLSIILEPSCWQPAAAKRCLSALKSIIGSPLEIIAPFQDWSDVAEDAIVEVQPLEASGEAAWLNEAVERTTGSWVCILSANAAPSVDALVSLAAAIGGQAEAELAWGGCDRVAEDGTRHSPYFPAVEWDAERHLRDNAAVGLFACHRDLIGRVGPFHDGLGHGTVFDWRLRALEILPEDRFAASTTCPGPLCGGAGARTDATGVDAARRRALERLGRQATLEAIGVPGSVRFVESLPSPPPSVSIIVRARQAEALEDCLRSIFDLTHYPAFDIVVVDVADQDPATRRGIARLARRRNVSVIDGAGIEGGFAAEINAAVASTRADTICLLEDRIVVSEPGWLSEMVGLAARADVGVVGADIRSTDGTLEDIGTVRGLFGPPSSRFGRGVPADNLTELRLTHVVRTAATASEACMAVRRDVWNSLEGLDAAHFPVHFPVVDFCRRAARARYSVLITPHAGPVRYDDGWAPRRDEGWRRERATLLARWRDAVTEDPYLSENLLISATSRPVPALPSNPMKPGCVPPTRRWDGLPGRPICAPGLSGGVSRLCWPRWRMRLSRSDNRKRPLNWPAQPSWRLLPIPPFWTRWPASRLAKERTQRPNDASWRRVGLRAANPWFGGNSRRF